VSTDRMWESFSPAAQERILRLLAGAIARVLSEREEERVGDRLRYEIEASAGPAREGLVGGGARLLVRVRMFDGPGVVDALTGEPGGQPDVCCDLRPERARELAFELLACAEHAERRTEQAGFWERER